MRFRGPILLAATLISARAAAAPTSETGDLPAPAPASADEADEQPAAPQSADGDEADQARPETTIIVTARRLDAARTRIDAGLGATVYSLNNDTIENRPGGRNRKRRLDPDPDPGSQRHG